MTSQDPYLHGRSDFQQHRPRNYEGIEQSDHHRYDYGYDSAREDHEREEAQARRQQARDEQRRLEEEQMGEAMYEDQRAEAAYSQYLADQEAQEAEQYSEPYGHEDELPF